ncbi:MAG: uracil-DNA glycosylase [Christensenellaceae bacterium]|jgi:uracil-DNA glycosylase family 4
MKYESLGAVKKEAESCRKCRLAETRQNVAFGEGSLQAKVMFIGEGPGAEEDRLGRPFVGPAGQLFEQMLKAISLSRNDVYIANIVKCRPPGNADPKPEYAQACMPYLREQVRFIRPKIIVPLGRVALQNLLQTGMGITRARGQIVEKKGVLFIPTYHPSALLRNPDLKKEAWTDFQLIRDKLQEIETCN